MCVLRWGPILTGDRGWCCGLGANFPVHWWKTMHLGTGLDMFITVLRTVCYAFPQLPRRASPTHRPFVLVNFYFVSRAARLMAFVCAFFNSVVLVDYLNEGKEARQLPFADYFADFYQLFLLILPVSLRGSTIKNKLLWKPTTVRIILSWKIVLDRLKKKIVNFQCMS